MVKLDKIDLNFSFLVQHKQISYCLIDVLYHRVLKRHYYFLRIAHLSSNKIVLFAGLTS